MLRGGKSESSAAADLLDPQRCAQLLDRDASPRTISTSNIFMKIDTLPGRVRDPGVFGGFPETEGRREEARGQLQDHAL